MSGQLQLDQNNRAIPGGVASGSGSNVMPAFQLGASAQDPATGLYYAALMHILRDPINAAAQVTVAQFHNADQQALATTAYGLLTGGVAQLLNAAGSLDRQRETGNDGLSPVGIATGGAQFAMAFATTDSTDNFAAGTRTFTPVAMSGTLQGVAWSIQVGSVLTLDSGGNAEVVTVTGVTSTTFTCVTTKAHNGTGTPFPITGFVYNQERDAAGELDGASGAGTAIATEYEYNGGGPGNMNYDRERNVQGKGVLTATISAGGGAASTQLTTTAAPTGLQPGQPIYLTGGTAETVYVAKNYTVGSTTVPLASATVNGSHTGFTYDVYTLNGLGSAGATPYGLGLEIMGSFDKNATVGQQYFAAQGVLGAIAVQQGGLATGTQAANTAANTVIKGSRGILCTAVVTTTGTAALSIYDNASTNSGTILLTIPASAAVGSVYSVNMPAANGITSGGVTNCPGVTISYV